MISRLYLFSFFFMFLIIMPVIVPLFTSLGLSMQEVFELQAIFGVSVVVAEIPTGYLGDLWGRKKIILLGTLINALGFTWLAFAKDYIGLMIFEITVGVGMSFVSGADVSLLYDSLDRTQEAGRRALANMQLASVAGESTAALLGGYLVAFSFQHVTAVNAVTAWIPFFLALTLHEPRYEKMSSTSHRENFARVFRHIFAGEDRLMRLIFVNLVLWGLATFFAVWIHQRYWASVGVPMSQFGLIWASYNLLTGLVGKQVHRLEARWGAQPLLWFLSLAPVCGYLFMSWFTSSFGIAACFLFSASRGVTQVLLRDALNWRVPSAFRATANSLQSGLFRLGFAIAGPGVGWAMDHWGLSPTLRILALVFSVILVVILRPLMRGLSHEPTGPAAR